MKRQKTTDAMMDGRVCVVTGANSGVGFETSLQLAGHGAHPVMVCRSRMRGERGKARIEPIAKGPVDLVCADLSNTGAVRNLVRKLLDRYPKIHALVNNAGQYNMRRTATVDGFEAVSSIIYVAVLLLTYLLQLVSRWGRYFNVTRLEKPFPNALDRSRGKTLLLVSEQLTGLVTPATGA